MGCNIWYVLMILVGIRNLLVFLWYFNIVVIFNEIFIMKIFVG